MSKINLLPDDIKKEIAYSKLNKFLSNFMTIAFLGTILLGFLFYFTLNFLSSNLERTNAAISDREKTVKDYTMVEREAIDLDKRIKNIKDLEKKNVYWTKLLQEINMGIPNDVYLLGVTAGLDPKDKATITGNAKDKTLISDFVINLRKSALIKFVDIENVKVLADPFIPERETNNFTLTFGFEIGKLK